MAVALALTACGSGGARTAADHASAAAEQALLVTLIAAAPGATVAEKSASFSATFTAEDPSSPFTMTMSGAMDFVTNEGELDMNLADSGQPAPLKTLFDNGVIYAQIPGLPGKLGGKPWLKLDLSALGSSGGPLAGLAKTLQNSMNSEQSNPGQELDFLRGVSGTVTDLGAEIITGVPTTHYRFPVDIARALASLPAAAQSDLQQVIDGVGLSRITADAWIDGQGVVRQFHVAEAISPGASPSDSAPGDGPASMDMTFTFTNFGAPVTVTLPPAGQVSDLGQMLNGLGDLGNLLGGDGSSTL